MAQGKINHIDCLTLTFDHASLQARSNIKMDLPMVDDVEVKFTIKKKDLPKYLAKFNALGLKEDKGLGPLQLDTFRVVPVPVPDPPRRRQLPGRRPNLRP
jgi:hypothetical protein